MIGVLVLLLSCPAYGQYYFGKNKVQYTSFEWRVLTTRHFEIYHHSGEQDLAQIAASCAEESYLFLENKFNHRIEKKVPLIIYSSPNYFAQTNVIPSLLPEGVGGFTEYMKGRMVIPFDGSYANFARVIRHEMVHSFVMHKISYVMKAHRRFSYTGLPLWFEEGLAEHWSREWDSEADMMIKDLIISGRFISLDNIYRIYGTYLMYKVGEAFCAHLETEYGDDKLSLLFENCWKAKNFGEVFELTFNVPIVEVWKEWEYSLKKKYYPDIQAKDLPARASAQLTFEGINIMPEPVVLSEKEWVVFKSNRLGYSSLCMMPAEGERGELVTLIKGERSPQFESLHLLESKIEVSPNGEIAFASKSQEQDVLYVYDIEERKIVHTKRFADLIELSSPTWSPDGQKIAFAGVSRDGYADLYLYHLETQLLQRLTNDLYQDKDPSWSPDGDLIAFESDRGAYGEEGFLNLFLLTLPDKEILPLTAGRHQDLAPDWSLDGSQLVFSSDRDGSYDLYLLWLKQREPPYQIRKLTSFLTGAFDPSFSPDGEDIYFTAYQDYSFQVHRMSPDSLKTQNQTSSSEPEPTSLLAAVPSWKPRKLSGERQTGSAKYKNRLSFDIAQSAISYDAVYGAVGGFQAAFTDMLGNHQYHILLGNSASSSDDFLSSFNVGLTYMNRAHRLNYGFGLYHLKDEYYDDFYGFYTERQYGGLALASYPLSKFKRVEASFFLRQSERDVYVQTRARKALLSTGYLSWILDTSIWDYVGPIDGTRFNLTLGLTLGLDDGEWYNRLVLLDLRKYLRIRKNSCYAVRLMGFTSAGKEPQRLYLGGSWSLRGYDRTAFYGKNVVLVSNELRYPLIDNLSIGFPFGKMAFNGIRGVLFFDAGNAWEKEFDHLYGSFGIGARISLGGVVVLRFDVSRITDFEKISKKTDFDFFFGWNF